MERRGGLERLVDLLGRVVDIRLQEITIALSSFTTFALVLGSYYLIRPIRENIGAEASADQRQLWFLLVFAVMLAAVPLFGWAVARLRRRLIVPGLYIFFAALMMVFWLALGAGRAWRLLLAHRGAPADSRQDTAAIVLFGRRCLHAALASAFRPRAAVPDNAKVL